MVDTLRVLLARHRMTMSELEERTQVRQPTIRKVMDEIPDDIKVSTLRKIAKGLPGVEVVIKFVQVEDLPPR